MYHQQQKLRWGGSRKVIRKVPGHSSKDNQIGLLLVVSDDGILHVTVRSDTHTEMIRFLVMYLKQESVQ